VTTSRRNGAFPQLAGPVGLVANSINELGEVVGQAETLTSTRDFLRRHGEITDLGTVDGDCFSNAFGANSKTQVVGQSITCDGTDREQNGVRWMNFTVNGTRTKPSSAIQ
jgi:probable HAF family extracellular repeat protein